MNEKVRESIKERKGLVSSSVNFFSSLYHQWLVQKGTLMSLGKKKDGAYNNYLRVQVNKTVLKLNKDASFRYKRIIEEILKSFTAEKKDVLCVGCRNTFELDAFEKVGFSGVKGIDIQSIDPRIVVMDMGEMTFEDNCFNILYSGDSLEHAYDVNKAISEFCRVVRSGGFIAIATPVNYAVSEIDRWDFKNVENLRKEFDKNVKGVTVVWQEVTTDCMKVIFRIEKLTMKD
jgi:SAM-dependent methyltransferase